MLIFLFGQDTFRSRQQLRKLVEKFKRERDPQGYNVVDLDCQTASVGNILEQILSTPFLAEKRLVILRNLLTAKAEDSRQEILARLKNKSIPENNIVIFWEGTSDFKLKSAKEIFQHLQKEKFIQEFPLLTGARLRSWVAAELQEKGGKISNPAISYLVDNTGGDGWLIDSLVGQLLAYCRGREIELADVQLFIEEKIDDSIFNLVDAIISGQKKTAFKMIQEQYRQGEDAAFVYVMLLRQVRILFEMRDLFDREDSISSTTLATRLSLHPFVVKKSLPFVKKYPLVKLRDLYQKLLAEDIKIKTGQLNQSLCLDLFVGSLKI